VSQPVSASAVASTAASGKAPMRILGQSEVMSGGRRKRGFGSRC
jgi:hypothetical protein